MLQCQKETGANGLIDGVDGMRECPVARNVGCHKKHPLYINIHMFFCRNVCSSKGYEFALPSRIFFCDALPLKPNGVCSRIRRLMDRNEKGKSMLDAAYNWRLLSESIHRTTSSRPCDSAPHLHVPHRSGHPLACAHWSVSR